MALNQDEKDLLALVRYYNEQVQKSNVAKLIGKLFSKPGGGYEIDEIAVMTGYSEAAVREAVNWNLRPKRKPKTRPAGNSINKLGPSKKTQKVQRAIEGEQPHEIEVSSRPEVTFDNGTISGRISQELYEQWGKRFKQGDVFLTQRAMMDEMQCNNKTVQMVVKDLVRAELIEPVDPANLRKGYVVK